MYEAGKASVVWKSLRAVGKRERRAGKLTVGRKLFGLMLGVAFMATLAGQASAAPPATVKITYQTNCSTPLGFLVICEGTASTPYGDLSFWIACWEEGPPYYRQTFFYESWYITDPATEQTLLHGSGKCTVKADSYSARGVVDTWGGWPTPFASLDGKTYRNSAVLTEPNGTLNGELKIEVR